MLHGYEMIEGLCDGLSAFMERHGFHTVKEMVGKCLPLFTTHADLVERQRQARREKAGQTNRDGMWKGDISREADSLAVN
jgi:hypothetical protein